ncbi:hypothetical protein L7F22_056685 [Adiantum nelumboides]|nr:hypothetical protein [Adiantum nelumboides]
MASSSPFFNSVCGSSQFWKKAGVGAGIAAVSGVVGTHYYNRAVLNDGVLSASLSDSLFPHTDRNRPWIEGLLPLACLAPPSVASFTEPSTGVSFPSSIYPADDGANLHQLAGVGLRKKSILGLKSITVYAFGVYANEVSLRDKLGLKYTDHSGADLKKNKQFHDDIVASDFDLAVRLVIVYGRLKIGSVRSAFEESIGNRIQKFSGKEDRPLLESFTSLFKDDIKLPKGTTIDVRRQAGHILTTTIDGKDLGSVQSPLLCRAFFDLYIGDEPFDSKGKEDVDLKLAALVNC